MKVKHNNVDNDKDDNDHIVTMMEKMTMLAMLSLTKTITMNLCLS